MYMQKHAYGNTETVDLWNCWSEVSGQNVAHLMDTWTTVTGYPYLKVGLFVLYSWYYYDVNAFRLCGFVLLASLLQLSNSTICLHFTLFLCSSINGRWCLRSGRTTKWRSPCSRTASSRMAPRPVPRRLVPCGLSPCSLPPLVRSVCYILLHYVCLVRLYSTCLFTRSRLSYLF